MPILGVLASAISGHLENNSYESIATVTVGSGGSASVSFTSIPSTYKHLQIRYFGYSTRNNIVLDTYEFRVGTGSIDTTSSYVFHNLYGDGSSAGTYSITSTTSIQPVFCTGDLNASSQQSGVGVIDLLDYTNTNKYKTVKFLGGFDINGSYGSGTTYGGRVGLTSGLCQKTTAIDTITMFPTNGSWGQYSSFALYGIKGA
jgi:hypothetical protein